ncbi:pro-resilin-like [Palaemon carinicauda]|uniref:pro-resilin-like n=1 Tax=Palaemon carinicauda TaxID=392227 RepID=UPI0035B5F6E5
MIAKVALLLCLAASLASGRPNHAPPGYGYPAPPTEQPPTPFSYEYVVKGTYHDPSFSHKSHFDGSVEKGEYRVLLPDSRTLIVTYFADATGFHPTVVFEGEAKPHTPYPAHETPAPLYKTPGY